MRNIVPVLIFEIFAERFAICINSHIPYRIAINMISPPIDIGNGNGNIISIILRENLKAYYNCYGAFFLVHFIQ